MGCIMVRQCHSNTCPVGVCTQDERLRAKFTGTADKVVNLMTFIAEEVREILAELGFTRLDEVIGRTDLLAQISRGSAMLDDLDLSPLLVRVDPEARVAYKPTHRNEVPESLDEQILRDGAAFFERGEKMQLDYHVRNVHRAIGARASSHIVRKFGMDGLPEDRLWVTLEGSCGQSLGAFGVKGLTHRGDRRRQRLCRQGPVGRDHHPAPALDREVRAKDNTIIGNTVLYGATSGKLFAAGQAGERFAVRNSGATVVVEGCGANGCEYMTGGDGRDPRPRRRELRRRHDRRHGLRLRSGQTLRDDGEPGVADLAASRHRALAERAPRADRGTREAHGLGPRPDASSTTGRSSCATSSTSCRRNPSAASQLRWS